MFSSVEVLEKLIQAGYSKVHQKLLRKTFLSFLGGALIALGFLGYLRVVAPAKESLGPVGGLLGALIFPVGLMVLMIGGGELATGNMMVLPLSLFKKKITLWELLYDFLFVIVGNVLGGIFIAFLFSHYLKLGAEGIYLKELGNIAAGKINPTFMEKFVSGIGCNWFVGLAVWLATSAKDVNGKLWAIFFPISAFVAIGFQHSVANSFMIPAAIFEGFATWRDFFANLIPVYLGNVLGALVFVSGAYYLSYSEKTS